MGRKEDLVREEVREGERKRCHRERMEKKRRAITKGSKREREREREREIGRER